MYITVILILLLFLIGALDSGKKMVAFGLGVLLIGLLLFGALTLIVYTFILPIKILTL